MQLLSLIPLVQCLAIADALAIRSPPDKASTWLISLASAYDIHNLFQPVRWITDKLVHRNGKVDPVTDLRTPWSMLNVPSYAHWSKNTWNLHVQGNLYKETSLSDDDRDDLINDVLIEASIKPQSLWRKHYHQLSPDEAFNARERIQQFSTRSLKDAHLLANTPLWCNDTQILSQRTNSHGDFDDWIELPKSCQIPNSDGESEYVKKIVTTISPLDLESMADSRTTGQVVTELVPDRGLTIVSDIDDVLRVAEVWNWKETLLNVFARPYQPWLDMPTVFKTWADRFPSVHFHYSSETPEPDTQFYVQGTQAQLVIDFCTLALADLPSYPHGSFDFRPMIFDSTEEVLRPRYHALKRLLETFPYRKFVLIGDTSSPTVMSAYPKLFHEHREQVQCILIRDTQATEPADWHTPSTSAFLSVPKDRYYFFRTPNDLRVNISIDHLQHLVNAENDTLFLSGENDTLLFGNENLSTGCFPQLGDRAYTDNSTLPQNSIEPVESSAVLQTVKNLFTALWWRVKCDFIRWPFGKRPSYACPFDRRPGEVYSNGVEEGPHDGAAFPLS